MAQADTLFQNPLKTLNIPEETLSDYFVLSVAVHRRLSLASVPRGFELDVLADILRLVTGEPSENPPYQSHLATETLEGLIKDYKYHINPPSSGPVLYEDSLNQLSRLRLELYFANSLNADLTQMMLNLRGDIWEKLDTSDYF